MANVKEKIIAGMDIGNGYVKGRYKLDDKAADIDMPACVSGVVSAPEVVEGEPTKEYMSDFFNKMIVRFKSPIVHDDRYFVFGRDGMTTGRSLLEFDIADGSLSKADQPLSAMLLLGCMAGAALTQYVNEEGELPQGEIDASVTVGLALPIYEYMDKREEFKLKFEGTSHQVTICNFAKDIIVNLTFAKVEVLPEGVSAQFAIVGRGPKFMNALLKDVRDRIPGALSDITAADVIAATNTCGIDIGEGTVNFPVITDGRFNSIVSRTINIGYGTVLEQSLKAINKAHIPFDDRKTVADFLLSKRTAMNKNKMDTIKDIVDAESVDLVDEIVKQVSYILRNAAVEVIYVYGGGATPLKDKLLPALNEKVEDFSGGDEFPILYLDSAYARNLNREGLYDVALQNAGEK